MKNNESIAMLMRKHTLPNDVYFYEPVTHTFGTYDPKTKKFVNETNYYYELEVDNYDVLIDEYVIIRPINYKNLIKVYSEESIKTTIDYCIEEYANENSTIACFATYDYEKNKMNIVYFDIDDIFLSSLKTDNFDYDIIKTKNTIKEKVEDEEENISENESNVFQIEELYKKVTSSIVAQDDQARRLIIELCRMSLSNDRNGILLTGQTGVGKTELVKTIGKYIDRNVYIVDSTQLTAPGYVGLDIEELLYDLYSKCNNNLTQAENSIIVFDEIDKKGSGNKEDISGRGVLNTLLKFIDGTTYKATKNSKSVSDTIDINTSKMIVIASGAFTDVYKNLKTESSMGFNQNVEKQSKLPSIEDFCKKAMMPDEFMGRFPIIINMNSLKVEDLKKILMESNISSLKQQQEIFKKCNVSLKVTPEFIDEVAKKAYELKTGARSLKSIITEVTWLPLEKIIKEKDIYSSVELTKESVLNPNEYKLVKRKTKKRSN